jgi:hypothetical protein
MHTGVFCSHRYYSLRVEAEGAEFRCFLDGKLLWRIEHGDDITDDHHSDSCITGELDGDEANGPEAVVAGSTGGFYLISARDGSIRERHMIGHAQGLSVGSFRPDLPGLEIVCGTRWDNYGIQCVFSGSGQPLVLC